MELSMFLAKLLGIYFLIMAVDMLLRRQELEGAVRDFASSKGLLMFSGSTSLLFGLAIVIAHPIYDQNWQGLITLLGYLLVIRGVIRFAFPSYVHKKTMTFFHGKYWFIFLVVLVLGAYLTWCGFNCQMPMQ
jgi:hypothetical protein